jgi:hypothetical protein
MLTYGDPRLTLPADVHLPPIDEIAERIDWPVERWAGNCHAVSLAIVKAGIVPKGRVARGFCDGWVGQHSWIVGPALDERGREILGDCHAANATIIDPTLHTFRDDVTGIYEAQADTDRWHMPHGGGPSIMAQGHPGNVDFEDAVFLDEDAAAELSDDAMWFLDEMLGPMDRTCWGRLLTGTVMDWPSAEIITAALRTPALAMLVPYDLVGMLTTWNPGGVYLHPDDATPDPRKAEEL